MRSPSPLQGPLSLSLIATALALTCPQANAADDPPATAVAPTPAPASAASAPSAPASAPVAASATGTPAAELRPVTRLERTLDSWGDFLDSLLIDALGRNPERRYRSLGPRKAVDLGRRWTLALDERPPSRLNTAGIGIPSAGQPARTWEVLHDGRINQLRAYNHRDGSGRENGGSAITTLAPDWTLRTQGLRLHDDTVGVVRTEAQMGVRAGSPDLWLEGFARRASLNDTQLREGWSHPSPHATFGGIQGQWEATPGLSLTAQHQRALNPNLPSGDERLASTRTEYGADFRPTGDWSGSRLYWREATALGLLSSAGVEERTTYRRVIGAEAPEGSPDGMVYAQVRQQSLVDEHDALLVMGWRHTHELAPQWLAHTLIETGVPIGGDNAVKSNTFDARIIHNAYPRHALSTELQAVRTPLKNSAFASVDFTRRLTQNSLIVARASVTGVQPHDLPTDVPVNSGEASVGWGWQEPDDRLLTTFWRYTALGRHALFDNVMQPGIADRRAHIAHTEWVWQARSQLQLQLRASRRWDRDEAFVAADVRTTNLTVLRATQQLSERWRLSLHNASLNDSALPSQHGYGGELSAQLNRKIVLAVGYNPKGVSDGELAGDDRLGKGITLRLYIPTEATLTHWLKAPMP